MILRRTGEHGVSPYAVHVPTTTIADLTTLLTRSPGRPRITWYSADGERVELSGAVLDNWVSKTTNLLVEELDAGPGTRVLLDLPGHWRTVVWALAAWRAGATVVLDAGPDADIVVTDAPERHEADGASVVAVTLAALARRHPGPLPAGAIDAASAVMTYGDVIGWAPAVDPAAPALVAADLRVAHGELLGWALDVSPAATASSPRVLVVAGAGRVDAAGLAEVLALLTADGSVVLLDAPFAAALAGDTGRQERLVAGERITEVRR